MTIYEIEPDFKFQSFYTSDPESDQLVEVEYSRALVKCESMCAGWTPLRLYEEHARKKRGNFARSWGGGFVVDTRAMTAIQRVLASECEFLPMLPYKGEALYLMNLLTCVDCLDEEMTKFAVDVASGTRLTRVIKYWFSRDRVPSTSLFKLPKRVGIFAPTGTVRAEQDFKSLVEREGLTGLAFKELWSDA